MKTKWNLNNSEQRSYSANAGRLKSTGLAIADEDSASTNQPWLRIEQSEFSEIYAGVCGGMALAISLHFTVLKSGITLRDHIDVTIPGCHDAVISLVPPPEGAPVYRVFGWLFFQGNEVLNHQIFNGRSLPIDRPLDGLLVAQSFDPLPAQFRSGMLIPARIRFTDLPGNGFTSDVRLAVTRCEQSLGRPKERPIQAGARHCHSSLAQEQELRGRARDGGAELQVKKNEPAKRLHV